MPGIDDIEPMTSAWVYQSAKQITAGVTSSNVALTAGTIAVRLTARGGGIRFRIGALSNNTATDSDHYLAVNTSVYVLIPRRWGAGYVAAKRLSTEIADNVLEISELTNRWMQS